MSSMRRNTALAAGGQGLMEGMGRGIDLGNAMGARDERRQRMKINQEAWDQEKAEQMERSELVGISGVGRTMLSMEPGSRVDLSQMPLPASFGMMLGRQPTTVERSQDGKTFLVAGSDGATVQVPVEQVQFIVDRAEVPLERFYGLKPKGGGDVEAVTVPTFRGGKRAGASIRFVDKGTRSVSIPQEEATALRAQYDAELSKLTRGHYFGKYQGIDSNAITLLDQLWVNTGRPLAEAPHRSGGSSAAPDRAAGSPAPARGIALPTAQAPNIAPSRGAVSRPVQPREPAPRPLPAAPAAPGAGGQQTLEQFSASFQQEYGREPSAAEIARARGKYWQ